MMLGRTMNGLREGERDIQETGWVRKMSGRTIKAVVKLVH